MPLNFAVPAAWCHGRLDISCQRSARFQRTLQFVDVNPLRIYGVGINYTGMGLDLPAPTVADLQTTFNFARKVWPTGDILSSGFTTISFNQNLAGNAANGCGSGFNSLLDQLKDIKGDTDDLVYGLLPTGTPLTGVGGCGGGGAGTGMVGNGATAAHEAGHAVGRKHAPCDDTSRCDSPQNQDNDFPSYGNYVSDSVGEYGFDPALNVVHDPATRRDFMGYSGNDWISPYTYKALFTKGDPTAYTPSAARFMSLMMAAATVKPGTSQPTSERPEWIRRRVPLLFLSLWVDEDKVTLIPSFTYPAYLRRPGPSTDYEVHLEGTDGRVLACVKLQQACAVCDQGCGPQQLQGEVPWDSDARRLVLRKNGKDLHAFDIEDAPRIRVATDSDARGDIAVKWEAKSGAGPLHFLVQWQDVDGTWRGVAPRTTDTQMIIPQRFGYARRDTLKLRLLAVHMLNTASAEFELNTRGVEPPSVVDVEFIPSEGLYRAAAFDPMGRAMPSSELLWYDEDGGEIARGSDLSLAATRRQGVATVRLQGAGVAAAEGFALLDPGDDHDGACGGRPGGSASLKVLSRTGLLSAKKAN